MDSSPNLTLPYIIAAQAQKHVTHNEAIRGLDALVQLMVLDKDLAAPPGAPADGNRYIVAASPTGAWAGQAGRIAAWQDGAWEFFAPREGWLAWVADEDKLYVHDGAAWGVVSVAVGAGAAIWGVNATADTTNRLAVKSTASLFDNVGNGHQQKINKAAAGDTASTLYQTNYSGRAEYGLTGDDDFHVKVSPDGAAWFEALVVDRASGAARFPNSPLRIPPQGRLTLTSATAVPTADVLAATTIYYTPFAGTVAPLRDGSGWRLVGLGELSLALNSNSGHTGYHQAGKLFDLFLDYNGGTPRLVSGPAWSNDTTRADAIARQDGVWVNNASIAVRFGTGSGNTATIGAKLLTYVGTFRATANGQTEDSLTRRLVWSAHNRVARTMRRLEDTNTWTYTTDTFRQANANAANQLEVVRGLDEDAMVVDVVAACANSASGVNPAVTIGLNSTTVGTTGVLNGLKGLGVASVYDQVLASWRGLPGLGYHSLAWLERSTATGTTTWVGDIGMADKFQCGLHGTVMA